MTIKNSANKNIRNEVLYINYTQNKTWTETMQSPQFLFELSSYLETKSLNKFDTVLVINILTINYILAKTVLYMTLNDLICNLAFVINTMFNDIHVGDIKKT